MNQSKASKCLILHPPEWMLKWPEPECCCKCAYQAEAWHHEDFSGPFSWVCMAFLSEPRGDRMVMVGDFEHGLCECFQRRVEDDKKS